MLHAKSLALLTAVVVLPWGLGGCAVAVIGGMAAAGGAGYEVAQERGVDGTYNDFRLKTDIEAAWLKQNPDIQTDVTVTVYGGRVLLTGRARNPEVKERARAIASAMPGVRALYDEIQVGAPEVTWDHAKDAWITARVRSELITDPDIRSANYTIETAEQSVYLIGSARTQGELDRATRVARYIPGVKRVVSYVEIRPGAPVAAQLPTSPPPSMGGGMGPGDMPNAAPRPPVQVERL